MKKIGDILKNPTAIAVVITHWVVVAISLSLEETQFFRNSYTFGLREPTIFNWLLYVNTPSLLIVEFVVHPFLSLFERNLLSESLGILILVCFVSFQWMLIGYFAAYLAKIFKPRIIKLSLK
ncbi:MAG: hypothetical protein LH614_09105 [Pyrinomonadaceae bacterium]|nr:hypothetical protein [Pyrinomonadaceae bacterium]